MKKDEYYEKDGLLWRNGEIVELPAAWLGSSPRRGGNGMNDLPWRAFRTYPMPAKTPDYPESERYSLHDSWKIAKGNPASHGNLIAHVYNHDGKAEEHARLMASAPKLLRGCMAALAYLTDPASAFPENRAAAEEIIRTAIKEAQR